MKKKIIVITALATSLVLAGGVAAFGFSKAGTDIVAKEGDNHEHEIYLRGDSVSLLGDYDGGSWFQYFEISDEDCIEVSSQEKYGLTSVKTYDNGDVNEGGTYYVGPDLSKNVFGKNNNIAEFSSEGYEEFVISFKVLERATFDEEESIIFGTCVGGDKGNHNIKANFEWTTTIDGYDYFEASFNCYSDYGGSITIQYVKLVFSC